MSAYIKKPVYTPFDRSYGIDFLDSEGISCPAENDKLPSECSLQELLIEQNEIKGNICDWQCLIDIELRSQEKDTDWIRHCNQIIGQLTAELHAIKKQIRRLKLEEKEGIAA